MLEGWTTEESKLDSQHIAEIVFFISISSPAMGLIQRPIQWVLGASEWS
jgi:hypothetical protein